MYIVLEVAALVDREVESSQEWDTLFFVSA